jgi:23S rRNA (cytosine1962-C5)-methyltransferase
MKASLVLKPDREKSILRRHPWVFSGAVGEVRGNPEPGETVEILRNGGEWLARGACSPRSQIAARLWTTDPDEKIDRDFFHRRLSGALALRKALPCLRDRTAWRLVNAESDGLPGIIVDWYEPYLVCQFLSAGAEFFRDILIDCLRDIMPCDGIYERSDSDARLREGLPKRKGPVHGEGPSGPVPIVEGPCRFLADVEEGQKTGFYLDQGENRRAFRDFVRDRSVLNAFSYTGGFSVWALAGGAAAVTNVDSSQPALDLAGRHGALNGFDGSAMEPVRGNVFHVLREFRDRKRTFGAVVLDPPKFAESKGQVERAARGYKDINFLAFQLLEPGGVLFTFSCSEHISRELFQKIVADAALDAGRRGRILHFLTQGPDHVTDLSFPEGLYLKGLAVRAD